MSKRHFVIPNTGNYVGIKTKTFARRYEISETPSRGKIRWEIQTKSTPRIDIKWEWANDKQKHHGTTLEINLINKLPGTKRSLNLVSVNGETPAEKYFNPKPDVHRWEKRTKVISGHYLWVVSVQTFLVRSRNSKCTLQSRVCRRVNLRNAKESTAIDRQAKMYAKRSLCCVNRQTRTYAVLHEVKQNRAKPLEKKNSPQISK